MSQARFFGGIANFKDFCSRGNDALTKAHAAGYSSAYCQKCGATFTPDEYGVWTRYPAGTVAPATPETAA